MKATYHTLGCKLNFSETATIARMLETKGIERAEKGEAPNICVVNTCSVTSNADKKGRQLIRSLASRYPEAAIMVTGCYAQLKPEEVAKLPNVAIVIGSNEKLRISQYIDEWMKAGSVQVETTPPLSIGKFMPSCERGERTRFFLKVQDGCDYFCTYCTIPFARGRSRSGKISELIPLAQEAAAKGGKEIVITGVNIGTFGKDHEEDFLSLLKALENVEGIERYRISSIEPNLLTDEILDWIANVSGKFMPHFHIPLQSGSDKVLKLMNRRYDTSLFESRIKRIRELIVDAFIGVDVIAGARGETSDEWKRSIDFMESLDVAKFHAFPYSEREGTKAILLGDVVAQDERYRRVGIINELSQKKTLNFIGRNFDKERDVLWEHTTASNMIQGFTDNYIRVEAPMKEGIVNHISKVKIAGMKPGSNEIVIGECL